MYATIQLCNYATMNDLNFSNITVKRATWQQHRQQLSDIRCKVFVKEQQVPVELELDDQDTTAQHWLAYQDDNNAIGTARLESCGKVGRMAVLKEFRGQGGGAALLRRIILDVSSAGANRLHLNAQLHALPFYERFGFTAFGDEFDEAGIPHIAMELDLGPYSHRARQSNTVVTHLAGHAEISNAIVDSINSAQGKIRIYCRHFDNDLLAGLSVAEALRCFFQKSSKCCLQLLIEDMDLNSGHQQPLLALQRQLHSRFEIRQCDQRERKPGSPVLVLFDDQQLIQALGNQLHSAQLLQQAAAEVRQHGELFDELWQRSSIPAEVRQLRNL